MDNQHSPEDHFLSKLEQIIGENISNEKFGVSELAREMGMNRSTLLRRVQKHTGLSVSQWIRQVRLWHAMQMLRESTYTVSEVSYKVGFSSTSYFIKCFREYYGYPPGEARKREASESSFKKEEATPKKKISWFFPGMASVVVSMAVVVLLIVFKPFSQADQNLEKSIAVLPFENDSQDSSNVYFINGLRASLLNDLQKIEHLRVISRTSVDKYKHTDKTIPEIAGELNASYLVEGSGQKVGDRILLHIRLVEGPSDKHLLARQYKREISDIFKLQMEVAQNIADEIQVIITPQEKKRMNKIPTDNLMAYESFLKGLDLFYQGDQQGLKAAIPHFKKAIEQDESFARAYANMAIAYYFLDIFREEKIYTDSINYYADQALLFDTKLPQSLIAKALFYMHNAEYQQAVPYLEKALEYNPNSALVINTLSDFYTSYIPNTEKYLEYALKGIQLDIAAHDSSTASFIYLHVSNALIQTGFVNEALNYINQSLEYNPGNLYSQYVKAYILYAKNRNLQQTKERLIQVLRKDTTRLDVLQETGKICYYLGDYKCAYKYYKTFMDIRESQHLDLYRYENAKIGYVLEKMGYHEQAEAYFSDFKAYYENDQSIYKPISLAMYYAHKGNTQKALKFLKEFSQQENYHYWVILFFEQDPLVEKIKDHPEFKQTLKKIRSGFWNKHEQIRKTLEEKDLL